MIVCKKCGYKNPDDNNFCLNCGSILESKVSILKPNQIDKLLFIHKLAMLGLMVGCMILCFIPFGKVEFYETVIRGTKYYRYVDLDFVNSYTAKIMQSGGARGTIGIIFFILCCLILVFLVVSLLVKKINKKLALCITSGSSVLLFIFGLLVFILNIKYITSHISSFTEADKLVNSDYAQALFEKYNNLIPIDVPTNLFVLYLVLIFIIIAFVGSITVFVLNFAKLKRLKGKVKNTATLNNNTTRSNESIDEDEESSEVREKSMLSDNNIIG